MKCSIIFTIVVILSFLPREFSEAQWKRVDGSAEQTSTHSQTETPTPEPRIGVAIGMGVNYVNAQDVVDHIRGRVGLGQDVPEFKSAVDFFGAMSFPLSHEWILKFEYAYLLGTYNVAGFFGPTEFSFSAHMPTIIGQYVLAEEGSYNIKAGAGIGYHFGVLTESMGTFEDKLTGRGLGSLVELEANTAFSDDFYGYIGANLRWEFIGDLTSSTRTGSAGSVPTLHFFGIGARFGFAYYI